MFIASAASGCSFLPASSVSVSPGLTNITSPLLPAVVRLSGMSVSTVLAHWSGSLWFSFFAGPPYMRPVLLHANVKKPQKAPQILILRRFILSIRTSVDVLILLFLYRPVFLSLRHHPDLPQVLHDLQYSWFSFLLPAVFP